MSTKPFLNVFHRLASAVKSNDGSVANPRATRYAEPIVDYGYSQNTCSTRGDLYVNTPFTVGTGSTLAVATAFSATAPSILIQNLGQTPLDTDIILRRLKLICLAAGTAITTLEMAVVLDSLPRYSSGGSVLPSMSTNSSVGAQLLNTVQAGGGGGARVMTSSTAIVATAANQTTRLVNRLRIKYSVPVIGDTYIVNFGNELADSPGLLTGGPSRFAAGMGPIVIAPQGSCLIYVYGAGMTASPTYELTLEYTER